MMMKLGFITVALLMVGIVSGEISTGEVSPAPAPSPIKHSSPPQSEAEMSPSPTMSDDNPSPSPFQFPEAGDVIGTESERSSGGGKKAGIAFAAIAAASMVGVGGYLLKKRRENIRRSRYEYAATEII